MSDTKYFEIQDWEAGGDEPVTFKLAVSDVQVPEGGVYDVAEVLNDLITAAGFNLGITVIDAPADNTSDAKSDDTQAKVDTIKPVEPESPHGKPTTPSTEAMYRHPEG